MKYIVGGCGEHLLANSKSLVVQAPVFLTYYTQNTIAFALIVIAIMAGKRRFVKIRFVATVSLLIFMIISLVLSVWTPMCD